MKKYFSFIIFAVFVAGCVAHVTPEGTYLEPIPLSIVLGPPTIVVPPHRIAVSPLPSVIVEPGRHIYFYNNLYYYYWDNLWYYGERERGPWYKLPREYYPRQYKNRDRGRDRYQDERHRGEDYRRGERY